MKKQSTYKRYNRTWNLDEFEHRFACWANNHNGWSKAKKFYKRIAKKREKKASMQQEECECLE